MSFTNEIKSEAVSVQNKKTCCRKAFALGMFMGAKCEEEKKEYVSVFPDMEIAEAAAEMLSKVFRSESEIKKQNVAGRVSYRVSFYSSAVADFLRLVDGGDERPPHILAGFRCENCAHAFLRGAFVACGSVSDPMKTYHAELIFPTSERAELVGKMLLTRSGATGRIKRGERFGIYYKNNTAIADMLYYMGCVKTGLMVSDSWIEHDIRNRENRATNCVARNISLSVGAAQRQISAIEKLNETGKIVKLPEELRYTARLRMENDSATLSELAMLHVPPITKSGLNGRLRRIVEAAEETEEE